MPHMRMRILAGMVCLFVAITASVASTLEQDYIARPGWCPGLGCSGVTIQLQHDEWHKHFGGTREFVDFHREFLAQSDDFRLYGADTAGPDPDAAIFSVVPVTGDPRSALEFLHASLNGFTRPGSSANPPHFIDAAPTTHIAPCPGGAKRAWTARPANLSPGNATFCGYTVATFGTALDNMFHGNGHIDISVHDLGGDMGLPLTATRDGAFFQWHKYIDEIYSDWVVSQYQLCSKTGVPIFFSVGASAVGTAGSFLHDRRGSNNYQGNMGIALDPATQYGAIPRIASDIYVADNNNSNILYSYGIRQWNTLNAWDVDAWSILNPPGNSWYFSVTMASAGVPGTPIATEKGAGGVIGGDVWQSSGGGTHTKYRAETAIGLVGAPATTDDLDALEVDHERRVQGTNDANDAGIFTRSKQFFSLRSGSEFGLQATSGVAIGPNDILQFGPKGELLIAVSGTTLGLGAGDDLDALALVDMDTSNTLTAVDRIYYSLVTGSPSGASADIFCKTVAGVGCGALGGNLEMTAASLGLLAGDELDALDLRISTPPTTGACCKSDGTCADLNASGCTTAGGSLGALGTVCAATVCPSAPGACCSPSGACSSVSDQACLASGGVFRGVGVACGSVACPVTANDNCPSAYNIPYYRPAYYEPPADNTYAYTSPSDPPYSCSDHRVFFPPYGSGTIWYYYDVPAVGGGSAGGITTESSGPARTRGLYLFTYPDGTYPYNGGAGDTRLAVYYAPNGDCSNLQEVACGDNAPGAYTKENYYAALRYDNPAPGRYYIMLSTVGDANRGVIRFRVVDPLAVSSIPTIGIYGSCLLALLLLITMWSMTRRKGRISTALALLLAAGLAVLMGATCQNDQARQEIIPASIETWPAGSRLVRTHDSPTLVMFASHRCECTQASLKELAELMSRFSGGIHGYVVFARHGEKYGELSRTANWIQARSIPGVTVVADDDAREAGLFGATTSGQVMLFDTGGRIGFNAGIAPLRGELGESPMAKGLSAAMEAVTAGRPIAARVQMPNAVLGCSLSAATRESSSGTTSGTR